jgi:hypothetical protein
LSVEFEEEDLGSMNDDQLLSLQYTRLPPLQPKNLTIRDVYPPEFEETLQQHWVHKSNGHYSDRAMYALPSNVNPVHYELEVGGLDLFFEGVLGCSKNSIV